MTRTLQHILAFSALAIVSLAGSKCAYAQEVTGSNYDLYTTDSDRERDRDRVVFTSGESTDPTTTHKSIPSNVTTKDSVSTVRMPVQRATRQQQPAAEPAKPAAAKSKGEDDSMLSFNFLYYIIQKYKLQDIVD
jgi:hypothetical protein